MAATDQLTAAPAAPWPGPGPAEPGLPAEQVEQEVAALCAADHRYRDGTVFNSICSQPVPVAARVFAEHLAANLGDNRIFPSLPRAGAAVTGMLGGLLGLPGAYGVVTSGGTEANLLAVHAAVQRWRRAGRGRDGRAPVLLPGNAHFSFDKLARLLPIEPVPVAVDRHYRVDVEHARRLLRRRPAALLVLTAGTSETGAVDDVPGLAGAAAERGVPVHVDAATGGFLVPFARELGHPLPDCGFGVAGVTSITVDPHKYGGAPIPAGHLLLRHERDLSALAVASHYRGTHDHHGLLGTRPGAAVLATYAALRHVGRAGYRERAARLFRLRAHLLDALTGHGLRWGWRPDLTVVGFHHPDPAGLQAALAARGLLVSVAGRLGRVRLVVHWHHRPEDLTRLVEAVVEVSGHEGGRPACG